MAKLSAKPKATLPDYVHPLGVRFTVTMLPAIADGEEDPDVVMGDTSVDRKRIRIVDTQDSGRRWSTLYHEYIHATLGLIGVDDALVALGDEMEEILVRAIETSTEQFLLAHGDVWLEALKSQREE